MTTDDHPTRRYLLEMIRSALTEAGFDHRIHNQEIAKALDITVNAVNRKLNKADIGWSDKDIDLIAKHLSISVAHLLRGGGEWHTANIQIGNVTYRCQALVGEIVTSTYNDLVLCEARPGVKSVCRCSEVAHLPELRKVLQLEVTPRHDSPVRVALLEDDTDALEAAVEILKMRGLDVHPFDSQEKLRARINHEQYDVIALDWWINGSTVENLIQEIRVNPKNSSCLLAIVTGELRLGGRVEEDVLERLIRDFQIKAYPKPLRWSLLAAEWDSLKRSPG